MDNATQNPVGVEISILWATSEGPQFDRGIGGPNVEYAGQKNLIINAISVNPIKDGFTHRVMPMSNAVSLKLEGDMHVTDELSIRNDTTLARAQHIVQPVIRSGVDFEDDERFSRCGLFRKLM